MRDYQTLSRTQVVTLMFSLCKMWSQLASTNLRSLFVNDFIWSEEIVNLSYLIIIFQVLPCYKKP